MSVELTGGYINTVRADNGFVIKDYVSSILPNEKLRQAREFFALKRLRGTIAPKVGEIQGTTMSQEFVGGYVLEEAIKTEQDYYDAGKLLADIHQPVHRSFEYTRQYYERQYAKNADNAVVSPPLLTLDWDKVQEMGSTHIHRDYWLGNVIRNGHRLKAIDWEFAGIGSPYEDFAIADLWIFREHGGEDAFWEGYGQTPDKDTIREFLKMKCVEFLSRVTPDEFDQEPEDGFYHNKADLLATL